MKTNRLLLGLLLVSQSALLSPSFQAQAAPTSHLETQFSAKFEPSEISDYLHRYLWAKHHQPLLSQPDIQNWFKDNQKIQFFGFFRPSDAEILRGGFLALISHQHPLLQRLKNKYTLPSNLEPYFQSMLLLAGEPHPQIAELRRVPLTESRTLWQKHPQETWFKTLYLEALLDHSSDNKALLEEANTLLTQSVDNLYQQYQHAQVLFLLGDKQKAGTLFSALPANPLVQEAIGDFYRWNQAYKEAQNYYLPLISQTPGGRIFQKYTQTQPARAEMIQVYLEGLREPELANNIYLYVSGQLDKDFQAPLQAYLKKYPQNPYYILLEGDLASLENKPQQAYMSYHKAYKTFPNNLFTQEKWYAFLWRQKEESTLENELNGTLLQPIQWYWKGRLALKHKHYANAITALKQAQHPYDSIEKRLAEAYYGQGKFKEAINIYETLFHQNPTDLNTNLTLAELYLANKEVAKAEKYFLFAKYKHPYDLEVLSSLGNLYLEAKRYDLAKEALERAILLDPTALEPRNNLGNTYLAQNQFLPAFEQYHTLIKMAPNYAAAHYNMACVFSQTRSIPPAIQALKRAFELEPQLKNLALKDPDLNYLRRQKEFQDLYK